MKPSKPLLLGLGMLALAGCDNAEQAAASFAEKVEKAAVEQARESFGETVKELDKQVEQLNDKIDQAQEGTQEWLKQAQPKPEDEQPQQDTEKSGKPQTLIET
ncbi:hypothetical protein [Pseudomonas sp. GOM6]|uniref:hypothetical protein n=1 Tax=Pseudomonas sp. GOM6 TaxID=3036944 RepID=UPI00240925D4|nr:hypothetical protein [Pseudomonas sp. GOM6]MDG1583317.1 hypothetical protein [Pseudomonas sp. GOM6]